MIYIIVPVHGGWSEWDKWSHCSVSCGAGKRRRFRDCTNPPPSANGQYCGDSWMQEEDCFVDCGELRKQVSVTCLVRDTTLYWFRLKNVIIFRHLYYIKQWLSEGSTVRRTIFYLQEKISISLGGKVCIYKSALLAVRYTQNNLL